MHEMALAQGILDIALKTAAANTANRITRIKVLIGQMTAAEPDALRFGFEALSAGTVAEGAELMIETVPLTARCQTCSHLFTAQEYRFFCPQCGSEHVTIVTGRELQVDYLEVE